MKKYLLTLLLVLLASTCFAWTPQTCILGPGDGVPDTGDNLSSTGEDDTTAWKMFRWEAGGSGDAYVFSVMMASMSSGSLTRNCAYAVWDDNAGALGNLKVWGHEENHVFNANTREYFNLDHVVTNRTITQGNIYWIGFISGIGTSGTDYWERAGGPDEMPASIYPTETCTSETYGCAKRGATVTTDYTVTPPSIAANTYVPNYYGWAVWTASDAGPAVTSTSGTWTHGSTNATITGYSFGTKSPVAPLFWDDTEGPSDQTEVPTSGDITGVVSSMGTGNKHYNDAWPNGSHDGGVPTVSRIQYRNYPYRSVTSAHSRSTKMITGCHDDNEQCLGGEAGQNVALNISDGSTHNEWYVRYYLRLDPAWPTDTSTQNYKFFNWEAGGPDYDVYSVNNYEVSSSCSGGYGDLRAAPHCMDDWVTPAGLSDQHILSSNCGDSNGYPVITHNTSVPNQLKQWVRVEKVLNYTGNLYQTRHNQQLFIDTTADADCTLSLNNYSPTEAIGGVTLEGFWKKCDCLPADPTTCVAAGTPGSGDFLDDNACRYFDDIYVDTTLSRVMMCNGIGTYASATICEPQIPHTTWNDTTIQITVNQGAIPNGTAYLFVFDSDNVANAIGYSVVLGGTDTTPPAISSVTPSGAQRCDATYWPQTPLTLACNTNEVATCKYSTSDMAYDSMANTFSTTSALAHSQSLTLNCGDSFVYYIRCMDGSSNKNTTSSVATFSLDKDPPPKRTYNITMMRTDR